jgi:peptidoglycan/xylan/chitin deacetylase (PgdA/CDA1 family)
MRQQLIRLALRGLSAVRADRWLPRPDEAAGVVVTLHHVEPPRLSGFAPNAHLSITPDFLAAFLSKFKANGWRFVALSEIIHADRQEVREPRIAVTLDDGFRDNLRYGLPIFLHHSVPFTIFVCPGFCDRTATIWWEALERIIAGSETVSVEGEGPAKELSTRNIVEKYHAFRLWADWLTTTADETRQRRAIEALAAKYGLDLAALAGDLVMNWDEVRTIAAEPLCSIGAHTLTHPALARLPSETAFREMQESATRIEAEIGERPSALAFPYGYKAAAGAREAALAEQAGFIASFTTRPGYVPVAGSRHGLPRISVNGHYQDVRMLEVLTAPGLWKLRDRMRPG